MNRTAVMVLSAAAAGLLAVANAWAQRGDELDVTMRVVDDVEDVDAVVIQLVADDDDKPSEVDGAAREQNRDRGDSRDAVDESDDGKTADPAGHEGQADGGSKKEDEQRPAE